MPKPPHPSCVHFPRLPISKQRRKAFHWEVNILFLLYHPNIVDFLGAIAEPGDNTPKFIDFGLSKEKEEHRTTQTTSSQAGTHLWMSPEKKAGKSSTYASDMYTLGLVIANLLTGILPRNDCLPTETYGIVLKVIIGNDDEFYRLILQCLKKYPLERPMAEDLHFRLKQCTQTQMPVIHQATMI